MKKRRAYILAAVFLVFLLLSWLLIRDNNPGQRNTIPKLSSLSLDTATTSNTDDGVLISGARVISEAYDMDDFLIITYQFNLENQNLEPLRIQAFEDIGPTTSGEQFMFLRDQPDVLEMTEEGKDIPSGTTIDLNDGDRKFVVSMVKGQVLGMITRVSEGAARLRVTAPQRGLILEYIFSGNFFHPPISALEEGDYTIEFEKAGETVGPISLTYNNNNGRSTTVLSREGTSFNASSREFFHDYQKFKIALTEGELLTVSGNFQNAILSVFSSRGKWVGGRQDIGFGSLIFETPATGEYYLIYHQGVYAARQSSFRYSIASP